MFPNCRLREIICHGNDLNGLSQTKFVPYNVELPQRQFFYHEKPVVHSPERSVWPPV